MTSCQTQASTHMLWVKLFVDALLKKQRERERKGVGWGREVRVTERQKDRKKTKLFFYFLKKQAHVKSTYRVLSDNL